jgi:hypothetical protein
MKTIKQPVNVTNPLWNWRRDYGRLRLAWISRTNWWLCGAYAWSWWFVFRHHRIRDLEYSGMRVGGVCQLTILGFQIAYCYRKDFKKEDHGKA